MTALHDNSPEHTILPRGWSKKKSWTDNVKELEDNQSMCGFPHDSLSCCVSLQIQHRLG
jgi:hypothetical protein